MRAQFLNYRRFLAVKAFNSGFLSSLSQYWPKLRFYWQVTVHGTWRYFPHIVCVAAWLHFVLITVILLPFILHNCFVSFLRHPGLPTFGCSGLPPVSLELQWPGRRPVGGCGLWRARYSLWLHLAWYWAHRREALLHLGSAQVCFTQGNAAGSRGKETQGKDE